MSSPTPPVLVPNAFQSERAAVEQLIAGRARIETELGKVIVGQREVIEQILLALLAGGHCLITGAPRPREDQRVVRVRVVAMRWAAAVPEATQAGTPTPWR